MGKQLYFIVNNGSGTSMKIYAGMIKNAVFNGTQGSSAYYNTGHFDVEGFGMLLGNAPFITWRKTYFENGFYIEYTLNYPNEKFEFKAPTGEVLASITYNSTNSSSPGGYGCLALCLTPYDEPTTDLSLAGMLTMWYTGQYYASGWNYYNNRLFPGRYDNEASAAGDRLYTTFNKLPITGTKSNVALLSSALLQIAQYEDTPDFDTAGDAYVNVRSEDEESSTQMHLAMTYFGTSSGTRKVVGHSTPINEVLENLGADFENLTGFKAIFESGSFFEITAETATTYTVKFTLYDPVNATSQTLTATNFYKPGKAPAETYKEQEYTSLIIAMGGFNAGGTSYGANSDILLANGSVLNVTPNKQYTVGEVNEANGETQPFILTSSSRPSAYPYTYIGQTVFRFTGESSPLQKIAGYDFEYLHTQRTSVSVSFDSNGAQTGTVPATFSAQLVDGLATFEVPDNVGQLQKAGVYFRGWTINGRNYEPGVFVSVDDDVVCFAWWSGANPEYPGETNPTGGGSGTFDDDSDNITIPDNPTDILATNRGISLFRMSSTALGHLTDFLFSTNFMDWLKNTWNGNYKDLITNLVWLPVGMEIGEEIGGATDIYVGPNSSGVDGNPVLKQYLTRRFEPLDIAPYWGNFLDFNPYTEMEIFLPFIGTQKVDVDLFMGYKIEVIYKIDVLTASAICFVSAIDADNNRHVLYTFPCSIGYQIPLGSDEFSMTRLKQGILGGGAVVAVGGAIAAAASAPVTVGSAVVGSAATAATASTVAKVAGGAALTAATTNKSHYNQMGNLADNLGALGHFVPYVTLTRPVQSVPQDFNTFYGYPSNTYQNLSNLRGSGYTEIESIHLDGFTMTESELSELADLLHGGVIL